jgi:hypothetical protein
MVAALNEFCFLKAKNYDRKNKDIHTLENRLVLNILSLPSLSSDALKIILEIFSVNKFKGSILFGK